MAEARVQRRLAAILAADVAGYSRLVEADEAGTVARLKTLQAELVHPMFARDGGRVVKTMGDGVLVEFGSAVEAVRNALALQAELARRNEGLPEQRRITYRVGINVGDVIVDGDDIHGDGVNVAARLERLCQPGKVYVSGTVYDHVAGKLVASFENLGEHRLKNLAKPVSVYQAERRQVAISEPAGEGRPLPLPDRPSIAVLPFEVIGDGPDLTHLANGLTKDLITDLSKISALFVIADTSPLSYQGQSPDPRGVAGRLGVRYVLEGSIQKAGARLRITAQLVDGRKGVHVWGDRYDRVVDGIFDLQDEIAREIVTALRVQLTDGENASVWNRGTRNVEAWKLATRAVEALLDYSATANFRARELAQSAVDLDPRYALAWGVLGFTYWYEARLEFGPEARGLMDRAEVCAANAEAIDDTNPWVIGLRAYILVSQGHHDTAIEVARRGVAKNPGSADLRGYLGYCLLYAGQPEEAIRSCDEAMRLNPLYPIWYRALMARALDASGQAARAVDVARKALQIRADNLPCQLLLASLLGRAGKIDEAGPYVAGVLRRSPSFGLKQAEIWLATCDRKFAVRFIDGLRKAGLPE